MNPAVPSILAIDDHPPNLLALEAVLETMSYPLILAESADALLARPLPEQVGLILMDVDMPVLDGYAATALLRRERAQLREAPVVFLTAVNGSTEDIHRGYSLGAVDYIVKPFDPHVLRSKIAAIIGMYVRGQRTERTRSEETHRIKNLFLGAVGHDLRNPLNAILGTARLLSATPCAETVHVSGARRIERSARRASGIVEDILDLTRGHFTGGIPLARSSTNLATMCRTLVDELRIAHPRCSFRLQCDGEPVGEWDIARLGRVLSNLLANAVQHGDDGPIDIHVSDRGALARFSIHNRGEPIPEITLQEVFDPFRVGDASSQGLGLGLFIVREIVHAHGGQIAVTSNAEDGTRFTVLLPKRPPDDA